MVQPCVGMFVVHIDDMRLVDTFKLVRETCYLGNSQHMTPGVGAAGSCSVMGQVTNNPCMIKSCRSILVKSQTTNARSRAVEVSGSSHKQPMHDQEL